MNNPCAHVRCEVTASVKQVEALERDNHEICQLLIKHVVTMSPTGPLSSTSSQV